MDKYFWKNKKVMVTGITGFLGAHLAKDLLEKKAVVFGLIRDDDPASNLALQGITGRTITVRGDITDYLLIERVLNEYEMDTVFHLAAQTIVGVANRSPLSTFESNIKGTWSVLEACRMCSKVKRVIVASSDKVYGYHKELPYKESYSLDGLYPYDASKVCADVLVRCYYKLYGLPVAVTRLANMYGEGDLNFSRIVPDSVRSVVFNQDPIIRSDGSPLRDYVYIKDAVRGYLMLAEKLNQQGVVGEAFNFGTNEPTSVLSLVNMIIDISGNKRLKPKILSKGELKGELTNQSLDSTKAHTRLGWWCEWSLKDGLERTYKWYEQFLSEKWQRES